MKFPDAASAAALPLHVLVRDFPETLAVLRAAGVDVVVAGGQTLESSAGALPVADLIAAMAAAAAWRESSPPGPCDRAATNARAHAAAAAREQARASADD